MKAVLIAVALGAIAEMLVLRTASSAYSESVCVALMIAGAIGSFLVGCFASRRLLAFCGSTALAAPGISYSMLGHGFLEMGGFGHAMSFGVLGLIGYAIAHRQFPWREPEEKESTSQ